MDNTDDIQMFGDVTVIELLIGDNWYKGTNYNYYGPARFPVPALLPSDSIADAMYEKGWEANV